MADFRDYSEKYNIYRMADMDFIDYLAKKFNNDINMKILDFGCGTGNYLRALQKRGYKNLFGLDPSEDMRKISIEKTDLNIVAGSHLDAPYDNDFFNLIILINVTQFINEIDILFKELYRICVKYGHIFIVTQSHEQIDRRFYNKYFPMLPDIDKNRYHDIDKLISVAQNAGFTLETIQDHNSGKEMTIDNKYFNLILNKGFSQLRYLSNEDFNKGIDAFKFDLANGNFKAKFAGQTIITLIKK